MDIATKTQRECEERVAEEYLSSLSDLNCNSKPLINMLTMLAEENIEYASVIVKVVEQHIAKVPPEFKLPILYLIDSIVKNVKSTYVQLFSQCIVNLFCGVFEKVNEKIRERMYALRQTWNEVFSAQKLYALDVKVKRLDNNWPITAKQPSIHVNPIFLKTATQAIPTEMEKILQDKTRELLELRKRKLELELEATKKHLEEQEKQFSKTAEGVLPPPVEALVAANALQTVGIRPPPLTGQLIPPGVMGPSYMGPQGMAPTPIRPPMYHHNVRGFRPTNMHQGMMNDQSQAMISTSNNAAANANANKPRVHPVNSALISSVRQRDPRLARQQQQQQSSNLANASSNSTNIASSSQLQQASDISKNAKNVRNHKSSRKSPTRSGSSSSGGNNSRASSGRSNKSSSREKERDRKRSDSKNSNHSSSPSNAERKKSYSYAGKTERLSAASSLPSAKCDKDAFEIAPLSSAFKRKSSSPSSSPSKSSRDSKRSNKPRTSRSKTSSRSPSPVASEQPFKDVDLRRMSSTSSSSSMVTSPEKRSKVLDSEQGGVGGGDVNHNDDHKPPNVDTSSASNTDKKNVLSAPSSSLAGSKTAIFNSPSALGSQQPSNAVEMMDTTKDDKRDNDEGDNGNTQGSGQVSKDLDEDVKKRPLAPITDEEPLAKKSKSTKLDNLFGTEDVDLRQLMPPMSTNSQEEAAPPPPRFNIQNESNENWDNVKTDSAKHSMKKSSLDDVRAKLAKTAKLNKFLKIDKHSRDIDQRNKLAELQMNDDTQEANDEKIRTMIAQAQELLESKSINQDQYKNLVKTVMSINEVNKLKEAKRRESLIAIKERVNDDGCNETERNAAREAILKKRIPKLNKAASNEQQMNSESLSEGSGASGNTEEPMRIDDKQDSNDELPLRSNRREKRGQKASKWGDRAPEPPMMPSAPPALQQQRPWNSMMAQNKRGTGFRPNVPANVRPPWPPIGGANSNVPQFPKGPPQLGLQPLHMRGNSLPLVAPASALPPPMIPKPCNSIDNPQEDIVRTITIDGNAKEIRFYDQVAIVFMEVDQPREIGFQNGQRTIYIDDHEPINLQFNNDCKSVTLDGETFNLRFGFPSRELFIDENWYEIYFGGPPISVPIRNKMHMLKAEGPPPQVNIGPLRRDLVVGKINMIVDAHNVIPLFLDARIQTFKLGNAEHTIQFADNLLTVLLDGAPTRVEYGGLPKSLYLGANKYFVRFGALPQGVVAGKVQIKDMIYVETKPPLNVESTPVAQPTTEPELNQVELQKPVEAVVPILPAAALSSINIDELFQKLVSTGILGGSSGILPAINSNQASTTSSDPGVKSNTDTSAEEVPPPLPISSLEIIKPIDLSKPESIKTRQSAIIATLFSGMQCSSCGVRFPPEQTIKYSQHLDWHFRQNRRERDTSRKAHARKWYYELNDWIQYEEIEDLDEREKNFFETQQTDMEVMDETSNQRSTNSPIQSCPAGSDDVDRACDMCQERFEQFYNEEFEEWHLRCAIRVEDKIYHPLCYEDYKASLNQPAKLIEEEPTEEKEESSLIQIDDDNAVDIVIKAEENTKEGNESSTLKIDDEDDDVIVLPNEEPSVTEIYDDDDDEYVPANVTREQMGTVHEDEDAGDLNETTESDVEIQEPHIPFTDLDTYVEKELPDGNAISKSSFMNVKIKEEPKEEEDEDDGFEDVGTVLIAPDEISIHSSEDTQHQMVDSSISAMSPILERPASTTPSVNNEENETTTEMPTTDLNISMDGNMETGDEHNLSAAGLVPSMPLASLVNKIKINITKNTVTTNSTANNSNSATGAAMSATNTSKSNSVNSNNCTLADQSKCSIGNTSVAAAFNHIPTISTIPVLCGGGTTISSTQSSLSGAIFEDQSNIACLSGGSDNSVSTISVIGSMYGNNGPATVSRSLPQASIPVVTKPAAPTPPPVEETIKYELKPALQKATLRKKEKVVCGNETSGLCSIM